MFVDETGANTKMVRVYGRCRRGERLVCKTPWGHWKTTTFTCGLRCDGLVAPWVLEGPMTGDAFRVYIEKVLAPTLSSGDTVIIDNLASHKVVGVREAIEAVGAKLLKARVVKLNPPGKQQALEALLSFRAALAAGGSLDDAARQAKSAASFKGGMRTLGARLMDHFALHRLFGLASTLELFGSAARRAHYTSALRYPVLKKSGNYAGDSRIAARPFMRCMIEESLADELAMLPKAWLVPFGPNALRALDHLAAAGRIDEARILGGLLHPGGQQWNRYNVQLDLVSSDAALAVPGGAEVLRRSAALRAKVAALLPE